MLTHFKKLFYIGYSSMLFVKFFGKYISAITFLTFNFKIILDLKLQKQILSPMLTSHMTRIHWLKPESKHCWLLVSKLQTLVLHPFSPPFLFCFIIWSLSHIVFNWLFLSVCDNSSVFTCLSLSWHWRML